MRLIPAIAAVLTLSAAIGPGTPSVSAQRNRDVITREELVQSAQKSTDLYKAIRSLRPHFLSSGRGVRSMDVGSMSRQGDGRLVASGSARGGQVPEPVLYIDGARAGSLEILKTIETSTIAEVRYLNPTQAGNDKGPGHEGGAILVTRHKDP